MVLPAPLGVANPAYVPEQDLAIYPNEQRVRRAGQPKGRCRPAPDSVGPLSVTELTAPISAILKTITIGRNAKATG